MFCSGVGSSVTMEDRSVVRANVAPFSAGNHFPYTTSCFVFVNPVEGVAVMSVVVEWNQVSARGTDWFPCIRLDEADCWIVIISCKLSMVMRVCEVLS